jgi:peptide/nickel transport system substrate-binding protein
MHGIAMYGDPALPPDFVSLPQVNPDAPKGGTYRWGEAGSFDSFNPFITKGRAADRHLHPHGRDADGPEL